MIDQFRCRFFVVASVALQYAEIDRELAALQCWLVLFFFLRAFGVQRARNSMPVLRPVGRCWQELWGFSRVSGELGGPGKCSFAPGKASSGPPPRSLARHVLAELEHCEFLGLLSV